MSSLAISLLFCLDAIARHFSFLWDSLAVRPGNHQRGVQGSWHSRQYSVGGIYGFCLCQWCSLLGEELERLRCNTPQPPVSDAYLEWRTIV